MIPPAEIQFTYARSSGPGGQNVNKVNSKAVLRWSVQSSTGISEPVRERLLERLAARLTRQGEIVISSDRFRDRERNRQDCLEKLERMIAAALAVPKKRKRTREPKSAKRKAREMKSRHSEKKQGRRWSAE